MKNNFKVSIIVPVYNTEIEYFQKCMKSLTAQTYKNIEIIIVDDGSKKENVIQYKQSIALYENVIFLQQTNGGVSSARNTGIEKCNGEYIAFVDSDDWVDEKFIEILMDGFEDPDVDISICSAKYVRNLDDERKEIKNLEVVPIYYSNNELYSQLLYSTEIAGFLWNKIFRKNLITQKLNESLYYSEDFVFTAQYCENVKKAVFWKTELYYYRQNQNSASNDFSYNDRIFSLLKANEYIKSVYEINAPEQVEELKKNILKIALNLRARYKISKGNNKSQYNEIRAKIKEYLMPIIKSRKVNITEKINIVLTFFFPTILFRIKNIILKRKINRI